MVLQKLVFALALSLQSHHKEHAALVAKTLEQLDKAALAKSNYSFLADQLKSRVDLLISTHLGAAPLSANCDLSKVAAIIN